MWVFWSVTHLEKSNEPRHVICNNIVYIRRKTSLAICFGDSQFRRNRTFNFKVSKYMLTNVHEYDYINRLTLPVRQSLILRPLAKTAYLAKVHIFRLKVSFFYQMFRFKSKKVKNSLNMNVMFTLFEQF